jgi:hypothetical protein
MLIVLTISFLFVYVILNDKIKTLNDTQNKLISQIEFQNNNISNQENILNKLQMKKADSDMNSENTDGLIELIDRLGEQQLKLDSQEKLISDLKDRITFIEKNRDNDKENNNLIYLKKYIIQSGDNLSNICILNGLNFNSDINIIKAINGIKDINMIHTGQTILLPIDIKEK